MRLIVGLGNPGRAYAHTRHNVGFDVLDIFARRHRVRVARRQGRMLVGTLEHDVGRIVLAKPQTYMNESGAAVGGILRSHRLQPEDLLVVYDDMDLPIGSLRIRKSGSSAGHKGMESIIRHLQTNEFARLRIGIGHRDDAINHVLSRFTRREREVMKPALQRAADALEMILVQGIEAAMNVFNRSEEQPGRE